MVRCALPGCSRTGKKGVSFFRFPKTTQHLWKKWKVILTRVYKDLGRDIDLEEISKGVICFFHFEEKHMIKDEKQNKRYLTEDAVPSIFIDLNFEVTKSSKESKKSQSTSEKLSRKYGSSCRLCLQKTEDAKVLTDLIREQVESLIHAPLNTSNIYPNLVCRECSKNVEKFTEFSLQILENQEKLSSELDEIEIKKEPEEFILNESSVLLEDAVNSEMKYDIVESEIKYEDHYVGDVSDHFAENQSDSDCGNPTDSDSDWNLENEEHEKGKKVKRTYNRKYGTMSSEEYRRQKIACDYCGKEVARLRMKSHIASKHDRSSCRFMCDICGSRFFNKSGIENHVEQHRTSNDFICEHCPKKFKTSASKTYHIQRVHKNNKNLVCHECGKAYFARGHFERHIVAAHTKERKFKCDFPDCNKTFYVFKDKHYHESYVHSGSRTCEVCGFVCSSISAMRKHNKKHLGNNLYCDYVINGVTCGKLFHIESSLKVHQKTHFDHREFNCPVCASEFKYKRPLITHYLSTHSTFRMTCFVEGCSASFVHKDTFKSHIKSSHAYNEEFLKTALQQVNKVKIPKLEELISKYS